MQVVILEGQRSPSMMNAALSISSRNSSALHTAFAQGDTVEAGHAVFLDLTLTTAVNSCCFFSNKLFVHSGSLKITIKNATWLRTYFNPTEVA